VPEEKEKYSRWPYEKDERPSWNNIHEILLRGPG